jgi:2-succinyl-6-hydroxy-2,4-cyclohexadiene-1-carboxylate synthase
MGHSLGASVVLHAAHYLQAQAADQLKGVVCIAAGGGIYQPRPFQRLRLGGRLAIQLRPQLPIPLGPFQAEERAALGLLVNSTCRGAIRQIPHLVADLEVANLWISGSNDQVMEPCYVRHLAGYSRQHELVFINNCGHLPMHTHAEHLQQHLQAWLKEER